MWSYLKHCLFVQKELSTITDASLMNDSAVNFKTRSGGKQYSPTIQKLHILYIAEQIPPAKICTTTKAVLKCFLPNLDVEQLKLPEEHCAIICEWKI